MLVPGPDPPWGAAAAAAAAAAVGSDSLHSCLASIDLVPPPQHQQDGPALHPSLRPRPVLRAARAPCRWDQRVFSPPLLPLQQVGGNEVAERSQQDHRCCLHADPARAVRVLPRGTLSLSHRLLLPRCPPPAGRHSRPKAAGLPPCPPSAAELDSPTLLLPRWLLALGQVERVLQRAHARCGARASGGRKHNLPDAC
eukprot:420869-Hanusia_phi.AAC.1